MAQGIRMINEAGEKITNFSKIAAGPVGVASALTGMVSDVVGTIDTISNMKLNKKLKNTQLDMMNLQKKGMELGNKEEERRQQWDSDLRRYLYGGRR